MLPTWYNEYRDFIDSSITTFIDNKFSFDLDNSLEEFKEILLYATKWWKKIRAILALEFYLIHTNKSFSDIKYWDDIVKVCMAIEALHAYSLIHDDLPCMDNDEYRRWELTVWKKYGEYKAVLAWDQLNTLVYEILSDMSDSNLGLKLVNLISSSTWFYGMIWWQVNDLHYEYNPDNLDIDKLRLLHNRKTWKLIQASIVSWAFLSWVTDTSKHEDFWLKLWLAFQIKDDLLWIDSDSKEVWKDVSEENKWFVYFLWEEKSRKELDDLISECKNISSTLNSEKIDFLIDYIRDRKK